MPVPNYLKQKLSMYEITEQYWDLRFIPTPYVFSLLAQVSDDRLERDKCIELSSPEGQEDWLNYCRRPRRTILEVLKDFHKSASKLSIERLFELFSPIRPRSFSIASSVRTDRQSLELLVAVVKYYSKMKKERLGLASNWLKGLQAEQTVYGWIKEGSLTFPDWQTPHILIGPGTGLAPFRSLIQERVADGEANSKSLHLYFGCRYKMKDFHCREELESYAERHLISLYGALSRDQDDKIYVQHKIAENKSALWTQIQDNNAYIYISGNAKNMPDNVRTAFIEEVFVKEGRLTMENAKELLKVLETSNRFQVEAW